MMLNYNYSNAMALNVQNTDKPEMAWVSTQVNYEFPEREKVGVNYTVLEELFQPSKPEFNPYGFVEYCMSCKFFEYQRSRLRTNAKCRERKHHPVLSRK